MAKYEYGVVTHTDNPKDVERAKELISQMVLQDFRITHFNMAAIKDVLWSTYILEREKTNDGSETT